MCVCECVCKRQTGTCVFLTHYNPRDFIHTQNMVLYKIYTVCAASSYERDLDSTSCFTMSVPVQVRECEHEHG